MYLLGVIVHVHVVSLARHNAIAMYTNGANMILDLSFWSVETRILHRLKAVLCMHRCCDMGSNSFVAIIRSPLLWLLDLYLFSWSTYVIQI